MNKLFQRPSLQNLICRAFGSAKPIPSDLPFYDIVIVGEKYGAALANQLYHLTKGRYNILLVNDQSYFL